MPQKIIDFINLAVAGLLGLLWWDIRNIRKEKESDSVDLEKRFHNAREDMFDTFLTISKHELLCENAGLKIREHVTQVLGESEKRILEAIRNNGKKSS